MNLKPRWHSQNHPFYETAAVQGGFVGATKRFIEVERSNQIQSRISSFNSISVPTAHEVRYVKVQNLFKQMAGHIDNAHRYKVLYSILVDGLAKLNSMTQESGRCFGYRFGLRK